MRRAIHTLRMRAGFLRKAPRGPSLDSQPTDETEIREHGRAADLLEALATPPETVEELRERVRKLYREAFGAPGTPVNADDLRGVGGLNCYRICVGLGFRPGQVDVSGRDKEQAVRAAWFAIIGMARS